MKTSHHNESSEARCADCGRSIPKDDVETMACAICHRASCSLHGSKVRNICKSCLSKLSPADRAGLFRLRRHFDLLLVPVLALALAGAAIGLTEILVIGHDWAWTLASL